jgi:hypothetical protein
VNTAMANAFGWYVKIRNFLWFLASSRSRDDRVPFEGHAALLMSHHVPEPEYVRSIGGTTIRPTSHGHQRPTIAGDQQERVPAPLTTQRRSGCATGIATPVWHLSHDQLDDTQQRVRSLHAVRPDIAREDRDGSE